MRDHEQVDHPSGDPGGRGLRTTLTGARLARASSARTPRALAIVAGTIERNGLFAKSHRVLVAFSGGADSTALALLLAELGYDLVLGHVDHGMRPGSGEDAERCVATAERLGLPIHVTTVAVDPPKESAARRERYAALEAMARQTEASRIATGHTRDDHLETVLLRLGRGGRAFGIPVARGMVVRPSIELRRSDTEAVCLDRGVPYLQDPSNLDESYARNRIRRRVVPNLGQDAVRRILARAEDEQRAASEVAGRALAAESAGAVVTGAGETRISRQWMAGADDALRRSVMRRVLGLAGIEPSSRLIWDLLSKIAPVTGASADIGNGWSVRTEPADLVVGPRPAQRNLPKVGLRTPGTVASQEWGLEISVSVHSSQGSASIPPITRRGDASPALVAIVDADAVGENLELRSRKPGDRLSLGGSMGSKKLQDLMVDEKVPRAARDAVPVVASEKGVIWIAGMRVDGRALPSDSTRQWMRLCLVPVVGRHEPARRKPPP